MNMITLESLTLNVQDLEKVSSFYQDIFKFNVLQKSLDGNVLGYDKPLLTLKKSNATTHTQLGLYHAAWRVAFESELGWMILHLHQARIPIEGFADHLVSKAVYLSDPEGNGIEIYWDRPKIAWKKDPDYQWTMVTEPLDVNTLIDLAPQVPSHPRVVLGHVHFYVDQLPNHEHFYRLLKMDKMFAFGPMASFMAYDNYHHHLGLNTWNRQKANSEDRQRLGLASVNLQVPIKLFLSILDELRKENYLYELHKNHLSVFDPSHHLWIISSKE